MCSYYLTCLGQYELELFDSSQNYQALQDSFVCYSSAIKAETETDLNPELKASKWFIEKEGEIAKIKASNQPPAKAMAVVKISAGKTTATIINSSAPNKLPAQKESSRVATKPTPSVTAPKAAASKVTKVVVLPPNKPDPDSPNKKIFAKGPAIPNESSAIKIPKGAVSVTKKGVPSNSIKNPPSSKTTSKVGSDSKSGDVAYKSCTTDNSAPENINSKMSKHAPKYIDYKSRLGLARVVVRKKGDDWIERMTQLYKEVIKLNPKEHDAYIELGELLEKHVSQKAAVEIYKAFPYEAEPTQDDLYLHGELTRLIMKQNDYSDPSLLTSLIAQGKGMGIKTLASVIEILDNANQSRLLMNLYAGVNSKPIDDPQLVTFFKSRYWL